MYMSAAVHYNNELLFAASANSASQLDRSQDDRSILSYVSLRGASQENQIQKQISGH